MSLLILVIALPHYLDSKPFSIVPSHDKFAQGPVQQSYISAKCWRSSLIENIKFLLSKYLSQTSTFFAPEDVRVGQQRYFFNNGIKDRKTWLKQRDEILAGSSQEEYSKQAPVCCHISHTVGMTGNERRHKKAEKNAWVSKSLTRDSQIECMIFTKRQCSQWAAHHQMLSNWGRCFHKLRPV